jgi:hypothetical protein
MNNRLINNYNQLPGTAGGGDENTLTVPSVLPVKSLVSLASCVIVVISELP